MNSKALVEFAVILGIIFGTRYTLGYFSIDSTKLEWGIAIPLCIIAFFVLNYFFNRKKSEDQDK